MTPATCINLGRHKDIKTGRIYLAHRIEDGEIVTTPFDVRVMIAIPVTSETGIWDKESFDKRFERA